MREGLRAGRVQPRHVTQKVIAQLDEALALAPEASPFYGPIKLMPASFAAADQARLRAAYREAITAKIHPAFTRLRELPPRNTICLRAASKTRALPRCLVASATTSTSLNCTPR